jgi:hypothetical protein
MGKSGSSDMETCKKIKVMNEPKCIAGCKHFTGGEVKHHKDCPYYSESLSKMYDDLKKDVIKLNTQQRNMLLNFASHLNNYKGLENLRFDFMVIDYLEKKYMIMTGLQQEFEATGYVSWINSDLYPDGKIYTQEYTQWLEKQVLALRNNLEPV